MKYTLTTKKVDKNNKVTLNKHEFNQPSYREALHESERICKEVEQEFVYLNVGDNEL